MKKILKLLSITLVMALTFPTTAFAQENNNGQKQDTVSAVSVQVYEGNSDLENNVALPKAPSDYHFSSNEELIKHILNGPRSFSAGTDIVTAEELIAKSQYKSIARAGDVSGTFTSSRMDTGTPDVTWDYVVDYTISPMPSGTGWYFKSVSCTVNAYKGLFFYTWASSGILTFTKATHTLSPSTRPTSLKVDMSLKFEIWTQATGPNPVTYTENHDHTTTVSNIYN